MKKLIIVIIIVILLLPAKAIINSNLKAEQLDAYGIAGLFVTLGNKTKPSPPKPDVNPEIEKCKCKNGKVSYDGGTSWTDCPCVNSKGKCDCGNTTESPEIDRVILVTQPRICLPCRDVEKQVVKVLKNKAHEKSGWRVGSGRRSHLQILDLDNSEDMNEINQLEISFSAVPSFFKIKNGKVVNEHVGSMSYSEFLTFSGVKKN